MKIISRETIPAENLPGRALQRGVGENSASETRAMTVSFAHYSVESGPMEPHRHAEETVLVLAADKGYVCWGPEKDNLPHRQELTPHMLLHIPENEWHVFTYDQGGFVDAACIYGTADNVRPEDNKK